MLIVFCFYTTEAALMGIVANADTNLLPADFDISTLSPDDIASRVYGSKLNAVVEQCQCATIWLCKACLLIMYDRITAGLGRENLVVRAIAVYVAAGFVFMELAWFFLWCRPFSGLWTIPAPSIQCSATINHLITNAVLNISSDLLVLCLAMSLFLRSQLPLRRKLILAGVCGIGVFVILCAVMSKYYSFSNLFGTDWTTWYFREVSTAVIVANLPFMWILLRRFCGMHTWHPPAPGESRFSVSSASRGSRGSRSLLRRLPSNTSNYQESDKKDVVVVVREKGDESSPLSLPDGPILARLRVEAETYFPYTSKEEALAMQGLEEYEDVSPLHEPSSSRLFEREVV